MSRVSSRLKIVLRDKSNGFGCFICCECGATVQCDWPVLVFISLIVFPPAAGRVLRKWFVNGEM